ncbi:MAG: glycosyltransferase family 2 protein [Actinomycetota bacterium]
MSSDTRALPPVSVVVPTHDRPDLLARALERILGQRYDGPIECLVVFDQREPEMPDVIVPKGRTLEVMANTRTPGLAGARNTGCAAAAGQLLAFCDDDDEWHPDKLRLQVEALIASPGSPVATCGIEIVYQGRVFERLPAATTIRREDLLSSRNMQVHSSTLLIRRSAYEGALGPVDEMIPGSYGEDYDYVLRATQLGPIVAVGHPLVRVHWLGSYYADRWPMIVSAIRYHLDKHPELAVDPRNAARMYGRMAFAHAASGEGRQARHWARRSIARDPRQPRGYVAYAVSWRLVPAQAVVRWANARGRGV